jgi:hypothetical protein
MKVSRISWILLAVGIFLIVSVSLGVVLSQRLRQRSHLEEELKLAQQKLAEVQLEPLLTQQVELEENLDEIVSESEEARAVLSQAITSTAVSDSLFAIADTYDVTITELSSTGLAAEELEGVTCSALPFSGQVEGNLSDIVNFVIRLNNDLTTGVVRSVAINIPPTSNGENSTASLTLVIYSYQGD